MSHQPCAFCGAIVRDHDETGEPGDHACRAAPKMLRSVLAICERLRAELGDNTDEDHGDIAAALDEAIAIAKRGTVAR